MSLFALRFHSWLRCGVVAALVLAGAVPARADTAPTGLAPLPALPPVMACADLAALRLDGVTDGAVEISAATVVVAGAAPYCEVRGRIAPAIGFVLRLPTQGWTQRYVQTGCGGLCGSARIDPGQGADCVPVRDGNVAIATTDMGHQGSGTPAGAWAAGQPQAQIDFAYRGVHATAQLAQALVARFYGQPARHRYFIGCSDGGREALMEAQRYPQDFDGIVAGAPALNMVVQNSFHHAWNVRANRDASGRYRLLAGQLPMLHAAVLDACDGLDGLVDGLIEDPRRCPFEPRRLLCRDGQDPAHCLSPEAVAAVQALHDGARDDQGRYLEVPGAHPWGSERLWTLFVPPTPQAAFNFSEQIAAAPFVRYLAHFNQALPAWTVDELRFTAEAFWQTVQTSVYLSAMDPDLSRFQARGGKLLLWHGWSDEHIAATNTIAYAQALRQQMGAAAADAFTRLYLLPGVGHCGGGDGPDQVDLLTPVMVWVETGLAPQALMTAQVASGVTTRTRPVYPYPLVARFQGGDPTLAANFAPVDPGPEEPTPDWLGAPLFASGYQAQCQARDGRLVCDPPGLPFGTPAPR
ncbi:tannase/feruloyl esterase family alpha/beta hydrolase [Ideonella sp. 4Y16]|uniref:tannase/feruloyl esterase family alpha/beta hydrolase n=1 Tax=Ideonella alba TaxID=2824118 RepID=UPI001B38F7E8|nr:tannase/feruloyl esterase family alpha/beta hydrolase [Ideonella alba]MBQ0945509.1 tannase/feruloyl esterase family alpha/beta hydrolase [Ideonella alba]